VQMDMTQYFRDWFPGYVYRTDDATPSSGRRGTQDCLDNGSGNRGHRTVEAAASWRSIRDVRSLRTDRGAALTAAANLHGARPFITFTRTRQR